MESILTALNISTETMGGYISIGVYAFVALCLLSGLFFGFKRGFGKTVLRIMTILLAAAGSYYLVTLVSGAVADLFYGKSLEELITTYYPAYETAVPEETRNLIASFDAETAHYILSLVISVVLVPVVFIIVFYILKAVLMLVYWLLSLILGMVDRDKGFFSTIFGGAVGLVQGAIVALVVLIPVAGFINLSAVVKQEVISNDELDPATVEMVDTFYAQNLDNVIDNPLLTVINNNGGDIMFTAMTHAEVDGKEYDMREQVRTLVTVSLDVLELKGMDWKQPSEANREDMDRVLEDIGDNEYILSLMSGVLRGAYNVAVNGNLVELEEPYKSLFIEALAMFSTSSSATLENDLRTILDVYYVMADFDVLVAFGEGDYELVKDKLIQKDSDGKLVIDRMIDILSDNDRTANIITVFTKLSVSIMCDSMGLGEEAQQTYETVKSGFQETLSLNQSDFETEEEYKTAVKDGVNSTLEETGIVLEDEVVDGITDYIAENYSDTTEISDADINDAILSYYSAYISAQQNGEELPPLPDGVEIPEGIEG